MNRWFDKLHGFLTKLRVRPPLFRTVQWFGSEYPPSQECAHSGALRRIASQRLLGRRRGGRRGVTA